MSTSPHAVPILVPRLGEGLLEARVVTHLKQSGERVERDEPVVELETDKAIVTVEAPTAGVVTQWLCEEGGLVPMGTSIGWLLPDAASEALSSEPPLEAPPIVEEHDLASAEKTNGQGDHAPTALAAARGIRRSGGALRGELPPASGRLTLQPFGVSESAAGESSRSRLGGGNGFAGWREVELSPRAKRLASALERIHTEKVDATLEIECDWERIGQQTPAFRRHAIVAWCAAQAMQVHGAFRSTWHDGGVRQHRHAAVGLAVSLPNDELTTAVVAEADELAFEEFARALRERVDAARAGAEPAAIAQLFITTLQPYNVISATPLVVPPACATLFVGVPTDVATRGPGDELVWRSKARLVLSFDHRFINGVGAAVFLNDIAARITSWGLDAHRS